jgi:uncharacterized membrane protein
MEFPEKDPTNYKWNFFYYNPNDERLIVPKPNPNLGFTLNFAKPKAYFFLLPILVIPTLIIALTKFYK